MSSIAPIDLCSLSFCVRERKRETDRERTRARVRVRETKEDVYLIVCVRTSGNTQTSGSMRAIFRSLLSKSHEIRICDDVTDCFRMYLEQEGQEEMTSPEKSPGK